MRLIKFTFWNDCDFANILYSQGFQQFFYLPAQTLSKPSFRYIDEAAMDGVNNENRTFQKVVKEYKCTAVLYEHQINAIALMVVHSQVYVEVEGQSEKVSSIEMSDPNWITQVTASIELTLTLESFNFNRSNCCTNLFTCDLCKNTAGYTPTIIDHFDQTDPRYATPVGEYLKDIYLIFTSGTSGEAFLVTNRGNGTWILCGALTPVLFAVNAGDVICFEDNDQYAYYYGNNQFNVLPIISACTYVGTTLSLTGLIIANTVGLVQKSTDGGTTWTDVVSVYYSQSEIQNGVDITVTLASGSYLIRIVMLNNSCTFGSSNEFALTVK